METYRDRLYRSYLESMEREPPTTLDNLRSRAPYLRRLIHRHFPADRECHIFEMGCGYGALLHFCRQEGYRHAVGVDRSPQQVETAACLGIPGVQQGDLLSALGSLADSSQDVVIAFDVLEHFAKDELLPLIDEVHRVLRPGGRWIVHVPNGESPFHGRIRYGDFTHETIFTRTSLTQVLRASGFAEVRTFEKTICRFPEILECYTISGDFDYMLKVVARDLKDLSQFLTDGLMQIPGVAGVRSMICLEEIKPLSPIPVPGEAKRVGT